MAERLRARGRLDRLPRGSLLRAYEECYGLELGAGEPDVPVGWQSPVATEAYPASIRARAIAVAVRCGRRDLGPELTRAARAVMIQPELHLLGNHVLENGFALMCAGAAAQGPEANLWSAMGSFILEWQLPAQFLLDGAHIEKSASYHLSLTAGLLECIELARSSGQTVSSDFIDIARRALGWIAAVQTPDGSYPLFNDAALDAAPSISDVLALGEAIGLRPKSVAKVTGCGELRLSLLEASGWARLDVPGATVVVDVGPDATGFQPGHAHADGLGFEAWIGQERALVDFGISSYQRGSERDETRATRSHNTVEIAHENSCEVWSAFRVGRRGRGTVTAAGVTGDAVSLELTHDGYAWLSGAPRHCRAITVRPGALEIHDRVTSGRQTCISRIRVNTQSAVRVRVTGADAIAEDRWHAVHGVPSPADLYSTRFQASDTSGARWLIEW
jgi:uncharacterized heparinase superfamily protein